MLKPSKYYHIYNHANGFENIFISEENFRFFITKYKLYISPVANTLVYCLMPNHFHFLIKIKSEEELKTVVREGGKTFRKLTSLEPKQTFDEETFRKLSKPQAEQTFGKLQLLISKQFSNLFSCYTQAFNKVNRRMGSLFIPNFKQKEITSQEYLQQMVIYIHNNPVKHGFTTDHTQWKFSSYNDIINNKETFVLKEEVISLFDNLENFKYSHTKQANLTIDLRLEK